MIRIAISILLIFTFSIFIVESRKTAKSLVEMVKAIEAGHSSKVNDRPIIGVLAQPRSDGKTQYIAASYVKFVEGAGGRVVPLMFDAPRDKLRSQFDSINGILFPGGGVSLSDGSPYLETQRFLLNLAKEANDKGDHFPVWATCLGFEAVAIITGQEQCLSQVDAWNISLPLTFNESQAPRSRLFGSLSSDLLALFNAPITLNNHHWGITPSKFENNEHLAAFWNVLSTNVDRNGKEFVSTIEAKNYPFWGVQFHPEKVQYEWTVREDIPHSFEAIRGNRYFGDFFLNEARRSRHSYPSVAAENEDLIYNNDPVFSYKISKSDFQQIYLFPTA